MFFLTSYYASDCFVLSIIDYLQDAIKTLKRNYSTWEECISLREIRSLRSISKHPNIVQIKELIREDDSHLHFVFEYMPDGNLFHLIKSCAENKTNLKRHPYEISLEKIQSIVLQVLKGLDHIHSFGFIHRGTDMGYDVLLDIRLIE